MKATFQYPSGILVKDKITGFSGVLTSRHHLINGSVNYGVQPPCKKGNNYIADAMTIDEPNIIPEDGQEHKPEEFEFRFATGDKVRNRVNGFEGIITVASVWLNGCLRYRVEGALDKDGKRVEHHFWENELEKVGDGLNSPAEKAKEVKPVKPTRGGPSERIKAERVV